MFVRWQPGGFCRPPLELDGTEVWAAYVAGLPCSVGA